MAQRGPDMATRTLFVCNLCGLLGTQRLRIGYHVIVHHLDKKPYKCPLCDTYMVRGSYFVLCIDLSKYNSNINTLDVCLDLLRLASVSATCVLQPFATQYKTYMYTYLPSSIKFINHINDVI